MLSEEKPRVTKSQIKEFRKTKWTKAKYVLEVLDEFGPVIFEASRETPHIRTKNVDYWPATQRFYDRDEHKWGHGEQQYIEYVSFKPFKYKGKSLN